MALTVYKVQDTRIVLPDTLWGQQVLVSFAARGIQVEKTDEDPESLDRSEDELARVNDILDATGL